MAQGSNLPMVVDDPACTCRGPMCQVCHLVARGGPMANEFKAGAFGADPETGEQWGEVFDLSACTCPPCSPCEAARSGSPLQSISQCQWGCF